MPSGPRPARLLLLVPLALTGLAALGLRAASPPQEPVEGPAAFQASEFEEQVLPLLERRCFECHGPAAERLRGKLSMASRADLLAGGVSGPALVPGDPDASLLVQAVRYADPDYEMPPKTRLPDEEVALLERWVAAGAPWPAEPATAASPAEREALRFFEQEVRPLLARRCFACHGPSLPRVESGLRMSGRAALLRGGSRGPAIAPGAPEESLLIRAVSYEHAGLAMPPGGALPAQERATMAQWVALGAPWPEEPAAADAAGIDVEAGRAFWSFQPPERPPLPAVERAEWVASPIDAFVLARLEAAGLAPNEEASERELVRRAYSDLVGLPPSLADMKRYLDDPRPDRWARLVDELLASPRYGERQGRRWLDVVRFAQTNGYERDAEKPYSWRYRDWVIQAFNRDLPYDRFLKEQLAGDELDEVTPASLVATGFYHLAAWDSEPDDKEVALYDGHDDVLRTITEGMMGLTVGCARCHDHRYDPIRQRDYYSMLALVRNVRPYGKPQYSERSDTFALLARTPEIEARWARERAEHVAGLERRQEEIRARRRDALIEELVAAQPAAVQAAWRTSAEQRTPAQRKLLGELAHLAPSADQVQAALTDLERQELFLLGEEIERTAVSFAGSLPWALVARENRREPIPTHLFARGLVSAPQELVEPAFPLVLCPDEAAARPELPPRPEEARSTGLRRALAEWIAAPSHPTSARVAANRVWQAHFGRGIVATPNDLGATGAPPTHPELLDWLACELVESGWSLKHLHRLIMNSAVYRMSSSAADEAARAVDPANQLLWRQERRRLDAEELRDAMLAVAGLLETSMGGRGFFPELSREALAGQAKPGDGWELSPESERNRRAVYTFVKRGLIPPFLELFDFVVPTLPSGARPTTTIASQALTLLNSDFSSRTARALAARARERGGSDEARVAALFELALARAPEPVELEHALDYLARMRAAFELRPEPLELRSRVPLRLQTEFLAGLPAEAILYAPRDGWRALRGRWDGYYNDTYEQDRGRGPAALLAEPVFADGLVRAEIALEPGCELAAVALRARAAGDVLAGLELVLDRRAGEARLVALPDDPAAEPELLASAPLELPADEARELELELRGARLVVKLGGRELLRCDELPVREPGRLALRAVGDSFLVEGLTLLRGEEALVVPAPDLGSPAERAFETLALVMLNLNEFVYVD